MVKRRTLVFPFSMKEHSSSFTYSWSRHVDGAPGVLTILPLLPRSGISLFFLCCEFDGQIAPFHPRAYADGVRVTLCPPKVAWVPVLFGNGRCPPRLFSWLGPLRDTFFLFFPSDFEMGRCLSAGPPLLFSSPPLFLSFLIKRRSPVL